MRRCLLWFFLGLLILAGFGYRLYYLVQLEEEVGGDVYNYLFISRALSTLSNPFIDKRLPLYALLLLPGHWGLMDPVFWGQVISLLAGVSSIPLLYLVARQLGLARGCSLLAAGLLAFNPYSGWVSLRPLSNATFIALALAATWVFLRWPNLWGSLSSGMVLALAAQTRHEGYLLGAALGAAALLRRAPLALRLKATALLFGPVILLALPFLWNNLSRYGNPLYSEYYGDVQLATSWLKLQENAARTLELVFGLLAPLPPASLSGLGGGAVWLGVALTLWGAFRFARERRAGNPVLFLIALSSLGVVLLVQPHPRVFAQGVPFLLLFSARGLWELVPSWEGHQGAWGEARRVAGPALLLGLLAVLLYWSNRWLKEQVEGLSQEARPSLALTRAIRYAHGLPGKVGLERLPLAGQYYLAGRSVEFKDEARLGDGASQQAWLRRHDLSYLIWDSESPGRNPLLTSSSSPLLRLEREFRVAKPLPPLLRQGMVPQVGQRIFPQDLLSEAPGKDFWSLGLLWGEGERGIHWAQGGVRLSLEGVRQATEYGLISRRVFSEDLALEVRVELAAERREGSVASLGIGAAQGEGIDPGNVAGVRLTLRQHPQGRASLWKLEGGQSHLEDYLEPVPTRARLRLFFLRPHLAAYYSQGEEWHYIGATRVEYPAFRVVLSLGTFVELPSAEAAFSDFTVRRAQLPEEAFWVARIYRVTQGQPAEGAS